MLPFYVNARGRLATVSQDGALAASYTYDMSEQRIVKAVSGEAAIHYHYDGEGRLIAETDAASGQTLREYIWLGLTPIASYGSSYDPEDPVNDNCNPVFRESLTQRLLDRQDRLALVQESIGVLSGKLDDRTARQATVTARKAELEAILAGVPVTNVIRIDVLIGRIADLEIRLDRLAASIDRLTQRLPELAARETRLIEAIARISARIERLNTICDDPNNPPPDNMMGGDNGNNVITLSFLHSDHLGRPKFATRADGTVSWDGGITTPFGVQVTALAAQTQALMFPGQYEDAETTGAGVTLSHNWHRTYDPTLGRYLQSDPIGLAGGLNRYAYVGGNPVSFVDPSGLILPLIVAGIITGAGVDFAGQVLGNIASGNPPFSNISATSILTAGVAGGLGGPAGALVKGIFGKAILSGAVTGAVFEIQQECATLESISKQAVIGGVLGGSFQKIGNGAKTGFQKLSNIKSSSNRNLMQPFSGPYADNAGSNIPPLVSIGGYTGTTAFNEARNR